MVLLRWVSARPRGRGAASTPPSWGPAAPRGSPWSDQTLFPAAQRTAALRLWPGGKGCRADAETDGPLRRDLSLPSPTEDIMNSSIATVVALALALTAAPNGAASPLPSSPAPDSTPAATGAVAPSDQPRIESFPVRGSGIERVRATIAVN